MRTLYTIIAFLMALICFPQQYSYRHYTIFDGLPQNQCMNMHQDANGFIWVATKNGVSRFDGKNFRTFLGGNKIQGYSMGFCEINNVLLYYSSSQVFLLNKDHFILLKSSGDEEIRKLYFDKYQNHFYCLTSKRIFDISFSRIDTINISIPEEFRAVVKEPGKDYFVAGGDSNLMKIFKSGQSEKICSGHISSLIKTNRRVYFTSKANNNKGLNGIYCWSNDSVETILDFSTHTQSNLLFEKDSFLYSSWDNNVWLKIDLNGNIVDSDSMPEVFINGIIADNHDNIWLNTESGLFTVQSYAFRNYNEKSGMPKYIWSIVEDSLNDILFFSYYGDFATLRNSKIEVQNRLVNNDETFLMDGICTHSGYVVVQTDQRIFIYKNGKSEFKNPLKNSSSFYALSTLEDENSSSIYFGTIHGVYQYSIDLQLIRHFSLKDSIVLDLERDKYGRIMFGTGKGVYLISNDTLVGFNKNELAINKGAVSLKRDFKGNMWYASKEGLHFYYYTGDFVVSDKQYFFISQYKNKYIIAGGIEGVLMIDLQKFYSKQPGFSRFFDRYNGFTGIECGQNGTCVDSKGNVWIPTSESVVQFRPDKLSFDTIPPRMFIYYVEKATNDLKFDTASVVYEHHSNGFEFDHSDNNIRITFHGMSLPCPERVKYNYRLVGYSNIWNETSFEQVTYTNLKPGDYSFEVTACNENGYWSKYPAVFSFRIVPAFWQTLMFKIFMLMFGAALITFVIYFIMRRKRMREKQEAETERRLVKLQMSTINAQLDPHFIFNTITAIGSTVQDKMTEAAYSYFVKMSQLLRSSLKESNSITRTLAEEIQFVENYLSLQKFRFGNRVSYSLNVDEKVDNRVIVPKMGVQIFVENAVKHGIENRPEGGRVDVSVLQAGKGIEILIQDNGVGRIAASKYSVRSTGVGLRVFDEFFKITNRYNEEKAWFDITDLYDESGQASGTLVKVFIPSGYRYSNN